MQSSSVSSDFASQFLNLDNTPSADHEIISMMNVKVSHEETSTQTPSLLIVPVTVILETSTAAATTVPPTIPPFTPIPQLSTLTPTPTTKETTSPPALPKFSSLFRFDQRVSALEKDLSQFKQSYTTEFEKEAQAEKDRYIYITEKLIKDIIKDEIKRKLPQILLKEVFDSATPIIQSTITESLENVDASRHDWFKKPERPLTPKPDWNARKPIHFRPTQTWISRIAHAEKPSLTFDELMSTPIDFLAYVMNNLKITNLTQKYLVRLAFHLLKGTCRRQVELEYHFEECYKAITDRLDWNNPKGNEYPFDLSKPLPLVED
ncbi:hypothetical protein Tco_0235903 [Tanacetum coccineum]